MISLRIFLQEIKNFVLLIEGTMLHNKELTQALDEKDLTLQNEEAKHKATKINLAEAEAEVLSLVRAQAEGKEN